jgi:hypothetical protein
MTRTDRALLTAVGAVLLLMAFLVLGAPGPSPGTAPDTALAGEPREVDLDRLRQKLLSGELSEREALFYRRER